MNQVQSAEAAVKPFATQRKDSWWMEPTLVGIGFALFGIYATWRAVFEPKFYEVDCYLSPFYSPKIAADWWQWSPAILILWVPAAFRATCYYYRKAYYRAYFMDPPGCGVGHFGGHHYSGETSIPFVFQNIHRYALYCALIVLGFLWWDAFVSLDLGGEFHLGVGSLVLFINCVLLSNYTLGCHAFRHLVGGRLDCFSCSTDTKSQHGLWQLVTKLNEHHMFWAWMSLFSVGFADFYVRAIASKMWTDITIIGPSLPFHHVI